LIGNAIQAMPQGGKLRVTVREAGRFNGSVPGISIGIVDTGSGIKPEDAKHLFEPFFSTKSEKGTGLGLWISRGIVQKYEGSIRFRSIRGAGENTTCFRVFIPRLRSGVSSGAAFAAEAFSSPKIAQGSHGR